MKQLTGFAEACYDTNRVEELEAALKQRAADKTDCDTWRITPTQWRAAIAEALAAKLEDADKQVIFDAIVRGKGEHDEHDYRRYHRHPDCATAI